MLGGAGALAALLALSGCTHPSQAYRPDPVTDRALADLASFTGWLERHRVAGAVTEVGWPAGIRWQQTARIWLAQALAYRQTGLAVYAFGAAPWWTPGDPLAFYRGERDRLSLSVASPQAETFERQLSRGLVGGVGMAEATFGTSFEAAGQYSSTRPGRLGSDYTYPDETSWRYLAGRGIGRARLSVMWERLQPELGDELAKTEIRRLQSSVRAAERAGVRVLIDLHNYGRYVTGHSGRRVLVLGSADLPAGRLADLWARLAGALKGHGAAGYELMNEPHDLPGGAATWESASVLAARAIRRVDQETPLVVGGYAWSTAATFAQVHARPWLPAVSAPASYAAHAYFDADGSGRYAESYAETDTLLRQQGWSPRGR